MKRVVMIALIALGTAGFAAAQSYNPGSDILGAHLNYGRGCPACHAPHNGSNGNGAANNSAGFGYNAALWGQDASMLVGQTLVFPTPGGTINEPLPPNLNTIGTTPDVTGVLMCLTCHDGILAKNAMMKNQVYEAGLLNVASAGTGGGYISTTIPTLLGTGGTISTGYLNDHPVGLNAAMSCTGTYNWDCTINNGTVEMSGPNSSQFVQNYGFFVSPGNNAGTPVVLCTTCHNQHVMNVVDITSTGFSCTNNGATPPVYTCKGKTGLAVGTYQTMFFLRGPYNPTNAAGNSTAQFCRQCHGGEANESNGVMNVKTVI